MSFSSNANEANFANGEDYAKNIFSIIFKTGACKPRKQLIQIFQFSKVPTFFDN